MPWTLAGAIAVLLAVLLMTLVPEQWRAPGAVFIAAWVVIMWHRDRSDQATREAYRQHARQTKSQVSRGAELRQESRVLRAVLEATPMPILVFTPEGAVSASNPAARQLLGRSIGELHGCELEDLLPQRDLLSLFDQASAGSPACSRIRLLFDGHSRFFDISASPIALDDDEVPAPPSGVILYLDDVTTLAESAQLRSDFAANASHELRTPIAAIRGAVETLGIATDDPEMTLRLSGMIARHAARLEALVEDLLDLSRLESETPTPTSQAVDLPKLTDRLAQLFEAAPKSPGVSLRFEMDEQLQYLHLDGGLLELVLRNLIENAGKFAHRDTVVRVVCEQADEPGDVRFRVIDEGQGIPLKHQERVFERFFQVDPGRDAQRQHRGTGLGLAIVKHAVLRLGGRIEIQSVLHEGTTVTIEFPGCLPAEEPPKAG